MESNTTKPYPVLSNDWIVEKAREIATDTFGPEPQPTPDDFEDDPRTEWHAAFDGACKLGFEAQGAQGIVKEGPSVEDIEKELDACLGEYYSPDYDGAFEDLKADLRTRLSALFTQTQKP